MDSFTYFVIYVFAPVILVLGHTGNTTGIILMMSKKLKKIGPRSMYCYLFAIDSLYLMVLLKSYLAITFNVKLTFIDFNLLVA